MRRSLQPRRVAPRPARHTTQESLLQVGGVEAAATVRRRTPRTATATASSPAWRYRPRRGRRTTWTEAERRRSCRARRRSLQPRRVAPRPARNATQESLLQVGGVEAAATVRQRPQATDFSLVQQRRPAFMPDAARVAHRLNREARRRSLQPRRFAPWPAPNATQESLLQVGGVETAATFRRRPQATDFPLAQQRSRQDAAAHSCRA